MLYTHIRINSKEQQKIGVFLNTTGGIICNAMYHAKGGCLAK